MIDWHVFAGFWLVLLMFGALGFGFLTAILVAETRRLWLASAAACAVCLLSLPFVGGYIATGRCGFAPACISTEGDK